MKKTPNLLLELELLEVLARINPEGRGWRNWFLMLCFRGESEGVQ